MSERVDVAIVGSGFSGIGMAGCRSWYLDEHGRNFSIWPGPTPRYWLATRRLRRRDYEVSRP